MRWLVQLCADVVNKSAVNQSGLTPYEDLHGKKPRERRIEFGERVFYSVPKQGRAKLDVRWKLGVFLGHTATSGEHFVGTRNGNVLKCRSCVRVEVDQIEQAQVGDLKMAFRAAHAGLDQLLRP